MELLTSSSTISITLNPKVTTSTPHPTAKATPFSFSQHNSKIPTSSSKVTLSCTFSSICSSSLKPSATATPTSYISTSSDSTTSANRYWMVIMETPPKEVQSKEDVINFYVTTLEQVLGSEKDAQMCIYHASCDTHFGFCCDIGDDMTKELASLPSVLSVRPDPDFNSVKKDYSSSSFQWGHLSNSGINELRLFPAGISKSWLVRVEKPGVEVVTKAQMVDYYARLLTKVLGNEKDAQMCIYHISWRYNFGFCCELDDECAQELAGIPGVISVRPDENFECDNKDYGGDNPLTSISSLKPLEANQTNNVKTKRLFVTGLSFYTSEKTLRSKFEEFGELVEVKVIMDKISKRSKGYAFIEYTTEEAAAEALNKMNGAIINGWMIVVDVAKSNPPRYSRGRPRPTTT